MDGIPNTRVHRLRLRLGLSQARFATKLGVSQATISRLEGGQPEPGPLARLIDALERDPKGMEDGLSNRFADPPADPSADAARTGAAP